MWMSFIYTFLTNKEATSFLFIELKGYYKISDELTVAIFKLIRFAIIV